MGPAIDARIATAAFDNFGVEDQTTFDMASSGVTDCWESLGIALDATPDGVLVHVDEPKVL